MNKSLKFIMGVIVFAIICFGFSSIAKATYTDTFTTTDGITAKKIVEGTNGDIEIQLSNITLNAEGSYTWGIGRTSSTDDIEYTANLGDFNSTKKTALISLVTSEEKIWKLLRETNTAYLFVKDETNNNYIINGLKLDLTLPAIKAFKVTKNDSGSFKGIAYVITKSGEVNQPESGLRNNSSKSTYDITTIMFKFVKITNQNNINEYHNAIANKTDIEKLSFLTDVDNAPDSGWTTAGKDYGYFNTKIKAADLPTDPGVYYLWLKGKDSDTKTIIGYTVVEIDADGPVVKDIKVTDPTEGTYNTPRTITIRVHFDETITATTVPTLKIRFGNSPERSLTNGTIKNNTYDVYSSYIEYKYNIQDTDVGQLATVSLEGGNVKDVSGNDATLSCPVITGNAIKANVEGTTTNITENQDKTNNSTSKISVEGITIAKTAEVEMGKTLTLRVTFSPTNASDKTVTWKSSDETVATVDSNGKVTPKKVGKTVITATSKDGNKTATCTVTVKAASNSNVKTTEINATTGGSNSSGTSSSTTKTDSTTAKGTIPQTGVSMTIVFVLISIIGISIFTYTKYNSFKDIK